VRQETHAGAQRKAVQAATGGMRFYESLKERIAGRRANDRGALA